LLVHDPVNKEGEVGEGGEFHNNGFIALMVDGYVCLFSTGPIRALSNIGGQRVKFSIGRKDFFILFVAVVVFSFSRNGRPGLGHRLA
jgi:hypothetical protein